MGPLIIVRVLEQNFTSDALRDTTPVSSTGKLTGFQFLAVSLALGASTNSQGSESKRLLIRQCSDRLYRSFVFCVTVCTDYRLSDTLASQFVFILSNLAAEIAQQFIHFECTIVHVTVLTRQLKHCSNFQQSRSQC